MFNLASWKSSVTAKGTVWVDLWDKSQTRDGLEVEGDELESDPINSVLKRSDVKE